MSAYGLRLFARLCERKTLQAHLGWRITAPANDNRPDWHPSDAA